MKARFDLTDIRPGAGGGVQLVATNLANALVECNPDTSIAVAQTDLAEWNQRLSVSRDRFEPIAVPGGRWGRAAWRSLNAYPRLRSAVTPLRRALLSVKSERLERAGSSSDAVSLVPAHYLLSNAPRRVVMVHDIRQFDPEFLAGSSGACQTEQIGATGSLQVDNFDEASALVTAWQHPYRGFRRVFPQHAHKLFLVPFPPLLRGTFRSRRLDRSTGVIRILVPAHVGVDKNQELVIKALPRLPQVRVTFTGDASEPRLSQLKHLAARFGVGDRVEWRGYIADDEVARLYEKCDLVVMPTRWEAASGPIFEAVAAGIPFIGTDIGPLRSQLQQFGLVGPLVDPDQPDELAEAVVEVVANYDNYADAQRGPAEGLQAMSWSDTAASYLRIMSWAAGEAPLPLDLMPEI